MSHQRGEQTAKPWKATQAIGVLGIFGGLSLPFFGADLIAAIVAVVASLSLWMFGRVGAWWYYG